MHDILNAAATYLLSHPSLIWLGVGALAFGESLAVLGTIIPATPMLLLIGTLLGRGILNPIEVIPSALCGAICGYWLSWRIGHRLKARIYRSKGLIEQRRSLARVRLFLRRWGGASLVIGRFVLGPMQSMLPLVAGASGMPARKFHVWNLVSGTLWVPIVLAPGYLAERGLVFSGAGQPLVSNATWMLAALSVAAILVMVWPLIRRLR
jgi:membrane protein DedA with SNARE-associated domain